MLNEFATPKGLGLLGRPFAGSLYGCLTPSGSGDSGSNGAKGINNVPGTRRNKSRMIEGKRKLEVTAGFEVDVGTGEVGGKIGESFVVADE